MTVLACPNLVRKTRDNTTLFSGLIIAYRLECCGIDGGALASLLSPIARLYPSRTGLVGSAYVHNRQRSLASRPITYPTVQIMAVV
jgi:hypothetical protein